MSRDFCMRISFFMSARKYLLIMWIYAISLYITDLLYDKIHIAAEV